VTVHEKKNKKLNISRTSSSQYERLGQVRAWIREYLAE
jgi:hypothetical protein